MFDSVHGYALQEYMRCRSKILNIVSRTSHVTVNVGNYLYISIPFAHRTSNELLL